MVNESEKIPRSQNTAFPSPVLQIASYQSAKVKKSRKTIGVRRGKKWGRENDADIKSGEYRR
jgi:hypothetical protein